MHARETIDVKAVRIAAYVTPERRRMARWITACFLMALPSRGQVALEGRWTGEVRLGPETMELVLDVERRAETLAGRITVPAERVLDLGLEAFEHEGTRLAFRIPHPDHPMDFSGLVEADRITGALAMGGREVPLVFQRAGATPAPPYREFELSFPGHERTVHGSLLLPPGNGPHRALALFHATSTGGRDSLRYFADLAARAGLAALIYDRRPVPVDLAVMPRADFLAVVADAEAAVRFLRGRAEIDAAHVGVGGLSQGAWISAMVAARVPEVAFVLALSAPGVPLSEMDLYQSTRRLEAAGVRGSELAEARALLVDLFTASRGEPGDHAALAERLESARRAPWAATLALPQEVPTAGSSTSLRWSAHDLDPALFFERLRVPVFLAYGERDERLPAEACAARLTECLSRAGNGAVALHRYGGSNHALLPAPGLEADLAAWLRDRAPH